MADSNLVTKIIVQTGTEDPQEKEIGVKGTNIIGNINGYIAAGQRDNDEDDYLGEYATAEGRDTNSSGEAAHAEGYETDALGNYSHAEGLNTKTTMDYSAAHAEGDNTIADGEAAHAEGYSTRAEGDYSHAEGDSCHTRDEAAHAEGSHTFANGFATHAEGLETEAVGSASHAGGRGTIANNDYQTVIGKYNYIDNDDTLFEVGNGSDEDERSNAFEVDKYGFIKTGYKNENFTAEKIAFGKQDNKLGYMDEEGTFTAFSSGGGIDGYVTAGQKEGTTLGDNATAEGFETTASGDYSHAEGYETVASNFRAHAEGEFSEATGDSSHAEGHSHAAGSYSHTEGDGCSTHQNAESAHAEGKDTYAEGIAAHAEGQETQAIGKASHAGGYGTTARQSYQTTIGKFNDNNPNTLFEVGNGSDEDECSNAFEVYADGHINVNGAIYQNGSPLRISGDQITGGITSDKITSLAASKITGTLAASTIPNISASKITGSITSDQITSLTASKITGTIPINKINTSDFFITAGKTTASSIGYNATAEGEFTEATKNYCHAEGFQARAYNEAAHAEGIDTTASGRASHAGGGGTIAGNDFQTAIGKYNQNISGTYFEIGNGTSSTARSNAFEVYSTGNATVHGNITAVSLIQSSDRNVKKEISYIGENSEYKDTNWSDNEIIDFIDSLKPVIYKMKDGGVRPHHGFIAQDIEENLNNLNKDHAALIKTPISVKVQEEITDEETGEVKTIEKDIIPENPEYSYGLRYNELISDLVRYCQILKQEVKDLKEQINN